MTAWDEMTAPAEARIAANRAAGLDGGMDERRWHRCPGVAGQRSGERPGRRDDTTPDQAGSEPFPASSQPAADRPDGAAQAQGRLLLRQPFEVAKHDWRSVSFRQAPEFFMKQCAEIIPVLILCRRLLCLAGGVAQLVELAPRRRGPGVERDARGHPEQPVTHRIGVAERAGLAHQDQPGGLEGVLHIVLVAQNASANPPDHWSVPRHQRGEGQLGHLALQRREPFQKRTIAQPGERPHAVEGLDLT